MATYSVNRRALTHARRLIDARQYVLNSDWGEVQPSAEDENAFLEKHSWEDYALWYVGLTEGATRHTKARHAFVYGDLRRVHRSGSSRPTTGPPSGGTRRSSWRRIGFSSTSTARRASPAGVQRDVRITTS